MWIRAQHGRGAAHWTDGVLMYDLWVGCWWSGVAACGHDVYNPEPESVRGQHRRCAGCLRELARGGT